MSSHEKLRYTKMVTENFCMIHHPTLAGSNQLNYHQGLVVLTHWGLMTPYDDIQSKLSQVMACCLMAPSHYLYQCRLIICPIPFIREHYYEKIWRHQSIKQDWKFNSQNCIQILQNVLAIADILQHWNFADWSGFPSRQSRISLFHSQYHGNAISQGISRYDVDMFFFPEYSRYSMIGVYPHQILDNATSQGICRYDINRAFPRILQTQHGWG